LDSFIKAIAKSSRSDDALASHTYQVHKIARDACVHNLQALQGHDERSSQNQGRIEPGNDEG